MVLSIDFGLKQYEVEGPQRLLNLTVNGDWTMSQGLSPDALLAALEPILWKATKHHIQFEKRTVERDVIVVTGNHFAVRPGTSIQLYAENLHDKYPPYDGYGDLKSLLNEVGTNLRIRFIDETTIDPQSPETENLTWTHHSDWDVIGKKKSQVELTNEVLKNLADQTGLVFTHEQLPEPVWFISEQ